MNRLLLPLLLALTGCAAQVDQGSQCIVESGYLDSRLTYRWRNDPPIQVYDEFNYVGPVLQELLRDRVVAHLASLGYAYSDSAEATFELGLDLSTRRELQSLSRDLDVVVERGEVAVLGGADQFMVRSVGFISADVYVDGRPIWRGWVEQILYPRDRDRAASVIEDAVPRLFAAFPP